MVVRRTIVEKTLAVVICVEAVTEETTSAVAFAITYVEIRDKNKEKTVFFLIYWIKSAFL